MKLLLKDNIAARCSNRKRHHAWIAKKTGGYHVRPSRLTLQLISVASINRSSSLGLETRLCNHHLRQLAVRVDMALCEFPLTAGGLNTIETRKLAVNKAKCKWQPVSLSDRQSKVSTVPYNDLNSHLLAIFVFFHQIVWTLSDHLSNDENIFVHPVIFGIMFAVSLNATCHIIKSSNVWIECLPLIT